MWIPSHVGLVANKHMGTTSGIGRVHLRQTIIFERFPEFGQTGADEDMAGKMEFCGYW
jgi:hypothetical protein